MCDMPFTFTCSISFNIGFTYIFVGLSRASPTVHPRLSTYSFKFSLFTSNTFLTSENPLEWTPDDLSPITLSPISIVLLFIIFFLSPTPPADYLPCHIRLHLSSALLSSQRTLSPRKGTHFSPIMQAPPVCPRTFSQLSPICHNNCIAMAANEP